MRHAFAARINAFSRPGYRKRSAIGLHVALGSRHGCTWSKLGCACSRLGCACSRLGCAWSRLGCAWSRPVALGPGLVALGPGSIALGPCLVSRALIRLRSVRILMGRPGELNALQQIGPSPKIVLDSNLNALENAANGKTFVIHCRPFRQRCISHRR